MRNISGNRFAIAGLAALIAAATAGVAIAGGHGHGNGHGGATASGPSQIQSREQARYEIAEQTRAAMPAEAGLMTMEQLQTRLRAEGYDEISEIEPDGAGYEVTTRNQAGLSTKLHLDAATGEILGVEQDD